MNNRERILIALDLKKPDRVPYMELFTDETLGMKLLNKTEDDYIQEFMPPKGISEWFGFIGRNYYTPEELCDELQMDGWGFAMLAEHLSNSKETKQNEGTRTYLTSGMIKSSKDLKNLNLPNFEDLEETYEYANNYVQKHKKDYAVYPITCMGLESVIRSFGLEDFSLMIFDNVKLIEEVLDIYCEWYMEHNRILDKMDFDFIWFADDIAFKNGLMFTPDFYRNVCAPRLRKVVDSCKKPKVYHTDGNIYEVMEDLISFGLNGIHPIEPLAMDIFEFKKKYGKNVCSIGNIDLNTLSIGSPEETYEEVRDKIIKLSGNGSYIMSSSNSLTVYCDVNNIKSMVKALIDFR